MKTERKNPTQEKGNTNIIQKKEGKSFVKPKGDANSFSKPTTSGKQNKSLPAKLQSNMETSLGQDFSNVGIHTNSQKAVQMKARAFTQSEQIHFAPGEFNPGSTSGQNLIGHEFTHIAQQRAGVVKPTKALKKGEMINDDRGLESEADNFGRKAARGETISKYRSASLGMRNSVRTAQAKSNVMQMAMQETHLGKFYDDTYALTSSGSRRRGVDMVLRFEPKPLVDAELIGLTQSVQTVHNGSHFYPNSDNFYDSRAIQSTDAQNNPHTGMSDEGTRIDRVKSRNNPIYGSQSLTSSQNLEDTNLDNNTTSKATKVGLSSLDPTANSTYQLGYNYKDSSNSLKNKAAILADGPSIGSVDVSKNSAQYFETTALAIKGNQQGTYYGSVQWGWETDNAGNHTILPLKVISQGVPSSTFLKTAEIWNTGKSSRGANNENLPVPDVKLTTSSITGIYPPDFIGPPLSIPANTRVVIVRNATAGVNGEISVVDGDFVGNRLTVSAADMATLSDERS